MMMLKKISILLFIPALLLINSCGTNGKDSSKKEVVAITPETALQSYLNNGDDTFKWELKEEYTIGNSKAYDILLTSQQWREHVWKHQVTILVPETIKYDGALLFISGGHYTNDQPDWWGNDDEKAKIFADIAEKNSAITAIIRHTPKQPLYDGLIEDELISFTLHNFKQDGDYSWPLLFPMVKSAASAMTTIQEFSKEKLNKDINRFTLTGASKRGWTSWLTGANDDRVEAIAPMVIDVLNLPVSLGYQVEAWNEYSIQIEDYTKLGIAQSIDSPDSPEGKALTLMIDPYSYRAQLTIPKLIIIGTNDEYWPVDAIKNYINDIPGENYIHYVANAGHDLNGGEQALRAISAFWGKTLKKESYNDLAYQISTAANTATLSVNSTSDELLNVYLWSADSKDRDFRDEEFVSEKIVPSNDNKVNQTISFPEDGFKAFYIDLEYADPNGGNYTKSTRMYVTDTKGVL